MTANLNTRLETMNPVLAEIVRTGKMVGADGRPHQVHSNIAPEEVMFFATLVRATKLKVTLGVGLAYGTSALAILDSVDRNPSETHLY